MTLNEIITNALSRLGRGTDAFTVDNYRDIFTVYANDAVRQIAKKYRAANEELLPFLDDMHVPLNYLSHRCEKVLSIKPYRIKNESGCDIFGNKSARMVCTERFAAHATSTEDRIINLIDTPSELAMIYMASGVSHIKVGESVIEVQGYDQEDNEIYIFDLDREIEEGEAVEVSYPVASVVYRPIPRPLVNGTDVPEIPEEYHHLVMHYVVACERCGGDPSTQATSSADFSLFRQGLDNVYPASKGMLPAHQLMWY